jgi:single-stranded DNA-specific DHH superfamily exonuclease
MHSEHKSKDGCLVMTTTVISHGDLDGITSGAIGLLALPGLFFYFSKPSNIAQDLFRAAKDHPQEVIISDIALNSSRKPISYIFVE